MNTSNIHVRKARPTLTFDHGRNTSNIHVRKTHPTLTSDHRRNTPCIHVRKAQHSHLMMRGTHRTFMSERIRTYIWLWEEPIQHSCQKGSALTYGHERNQSSIHVRRALHLHLTMIGTNPAFMLERIYTYIWNMRGTNPTYMFERALHLHLHMWGTNPICMS